ncbi:MAG: dTDP-glucose 4,6-dehydratase [Chloroflexi bacterium]|nr:dTDP-glucose 4,6-dehydratase [Chloroflexota bacterium]
MRLLVTGGAGFIGSTFVRRRLDATDDSVIVLDKLTYAGDLANLAEVAERPDAATRYRFVEGDIADAPLVAELVREVDAVVSFAAESHVDRSILEPTAFLVTGVMGVHALLEAVRVAQGGRRKSAVRLLQVSTDEVYGPVAAGLAPETHPVRPTSPYSAAKASGDLLVQAYRETYGLDTVITRGANTYGPAQHPEKLVPLFITNALQDLPLPMYGDGTQVRDWLYVDDHADAVSVVLDRGSPGTIYNVPGDGSEQSNRAVTEAILAALGKPWSLVREVPDRPGHDRRYALDGSRLRDLGWMPTVAFEDGIDRTVRWYVEHESRWRSTQGAGWADYYERQYAWRLERSVPS